MEEFEEFLSTLAEKYDRAFEQLDVNIAFDALGTTPPEDHDNCPVHNRIDVEDYDPSDDDQRMYAITYVGEYAVYTGDDIDSLPKDPFVLGQMLMMNPEALSKSIGYAVKVYWVADGAIESNGVIGATELVVRVDSCYRAKMLHDDIVKVLREGGDGNDLRDLYNRS